MQNFAKLGYCPVTSEPYLLNRAISSKAAVFIDPPGRDQLWSLALDEPPESESVGL